jgi:hypothetical protein
MILPDLRSAAFQSIMPIMTSDRYANIALLRNEIAAAAARMIAEDGASYDTAKRKAARQILGGMRINGEALPDNEEIENEVRIYNELFLSDTQPERLKHMRQIALRLMTELEQFQPYLTGAVLNGTAGEHSDLHLHLFTDSAKDVQIFLLNKNVDFEVTESERFSGNGRLVETISFMWQGEGVHLTVFDTDDVRGAFKAGSQGRAERVDIQKLRQIIQGSEAS